jgi:hypothetical protein
VLRVVDIQTVSIAIASAGVFLAAIYYILQIRHQTKLRQTDMVMRLYATFGSTEFQKAYQNVVSLEFEDFTDFMKKYAADIEVRTALNSVGIFFEGVGVLAKRKLIDMDLVDDLFTSPISRTWERMAPIIKGRREQLKSPSIGEWQEYLYNEMKKREQPKWKTLLSLFLSIFIHGVLWEISMSIGNTGDVSRSMCFS